MEEKKKEKKILDVRALGRELEQQNTLDSLERRGLLNTPPQETQVIESRHSCSVCGRPVAPCMLQSYRGENHCNDCLKKARGGFDELERDIKRLKR